MGRLKRRLEMIDMTDIEELVIQTRRVDFEKWIIETNGSYLAIRQVLKET